MHTRLELQEKLEDILGSRNVYFQPPENLKIQYPAIIYTRATLWNDFADDIVYGQRWGFDITLIDANPDSPFIKDISKLPKCRFDRHYVVDNLNHDTFTIYLD